MGFENPTRGISRPLLLPPSPDRHASVEGAVCPRQSQEGDTRSSRARHGGEGRYRGGSLSRSGLLQPDLPSAETRQQVETSDRPLGSECPCTLPILQDGDPSVGTQGGPQGPVANVLGPVGCVLPYTHPSGQQEVPQVPPSGRSVAIPSTTLWFKHRSARVHKGHGPTGGLCSSSRCKFTSLHRRLAIKSSVGRGVCLPHTVVNPTVSPVGMDSKSGKVRSNPIPVSHVPGYEIRHSDRPSLSLRQEGRKMGLLREGLHDTEGSARPVMATSVGPIMFARKTSPIRSSTYPSCSTTAQPELESVVGPSLCDGPDRRPDQGVPEMVANHHQYSQGDSNRSTRDTCVSVHRQQFSGLGCTFSAPDSLRRVGRSGQGPSHQCPGTEGHLVRPTGISGYVAGLQCCNNVRQCFRNSLYTQSGRYPVASDVRLGSTDLYMGRVKTNDSNTQTSPGTFKCLSGPIEQETSDSENRMEPSPGRSGPSVQILGQTDGRSVCPETQFENSNVYVSDTRTGGMEGRQPGTVMEGALRLRVSPDLSDQIGIIEDNSRQGRGHSDSATLAASGVVRRSHQTVNSFSPGIASDSEVAETNILIPIPQSPGSSQPSRVEVISRFSQARGFSQEVSSRLSVSQRQSTVQLYEYKWKVFREWCASQRIDPNTPTIPNIADFLLHLFNKGLSITTIKGYRSSLSALMSSRGIDISHDGDLNALCRGFSLERPIHHREIPRWDLMVVLRYLMKPPFEPMSQCSLADLTRKTAFLVTLATAKRNSEVWAFSADVQFGQDKSSATLSFLPGFLAKTQRADKPETALNPVKIPALSQIIGRDLPDRTLCPVRALLFYTDRTKVCDPSRQRRLFIAFKPGHKGDIVKVTISGWIKGLIRSAYGKVDCDDVPHLTHTQFQARELRAMATSLAFHQHHSLRQVMDAASWRADGTFASFYLRDLTPATLDPSVGSLVVAQSVVVPTEK